MDGSKKNMFKKQLVMEQEEFKALLHDIKIAVKGKKPAEVRVSYEDGRVNFQVQGAVIKATAEGRWPGAARFPVPFLRAAIKVPFHGGSVVIKYEDDRFHMNKASVSAAWEDISPPPINIPLDAPLLEKALLRYRYSQQQIVSSGLMPVLEEAEAIVERKIRKAAELLEGLDIHREDLAEWIASRLKQTAQDRTAR